MKKTIIFIFILLLAGFNIGWSWDTFSIRKTVKPTFQVQTLWLVDMLADRKIKAQFINNSPPLITEHLVIQGSPVVGVKAYTKEEGKLVWSFPVKSGVVSPLVLYKENIYFGGGDGFFYSLKMKTGSLNWKFFTDSKNSGAPLIYGGKIYWSTGSQKLYALSLSGKQLWIYPGPFPSTDFVVFGRPGPVVYRNLIYMGFYNGKLVALEKNTGKLQWERQLSSSQPIRENLGFKEPCLFIPVFESHLFCLEPLSGKTIWKTKGGSSLFYPKNFSVIYQFYKDKLYAVNKKEGSIIWEKKVGSGAFPFASRTLGKYLVYGFPSKGHLVFVNRKNGKTLGKYQFGKGLAGPVSVDSEKKEIYFLSIDGYLRKISI